VEADEDRPGIALDGLAVQLLCRFALVGGQSDAQLAGIGEGELGIPRDRRVEVAKRPAKITAPVLDNGRAKEPAQALEIGAAGEPGEGRTGGGVDPVPESRLERRIDGGKGRDRRVEDELADRALTVGLAIGLHSALELGIACLSEQRDQLQPVRLGKPFRSCRAPSGDQRQQSG
jgi:hypothetical protein